jgi:hypothetical protein
VITMNANGTLLLAGALFAGCGASEVRVEELSAARHEREAASEERQALEHEGRYDPAARRSVGGARSGEAYFGVDVYNPTEGELRAAQQHREHAHAHRDAAEQLRAFEERECAHFPSETRVACPLLAGAVIRVEDVDGGVMLIFADGVDPTPVLDHIRCHLAYAASRGRDALAECALYVEGAVLEVTSDGATLTTDAQAHVAELRRRVRVQLP